MKDIGCMALVFFFMELFLLTFTPSFNNPKSLLTLAIIKLSSLFENLQKEHQYHEDKNASLFTSKGA